MKIITVLITLVLLFSCSESSIFIKESEKLNEALEKWEAKGSDNYSYTLKRSCYCGIIFPFGSKIEVVNSEINRVLDPETQNDLTVIVAGDTVNVIDAYPDLFYTIDGFFEKLSDDLKSADEFEGHYNAKLGYPESVSIDFRLNAVDDELNYQISDFSVATEQN